MTGTRLVQAETYRGLLSHLSAKTADHFQASFHALNEAAKQRAENPQRAEPN